MELKAIPVHPGIGMEVQDVDIAEELAADVHVQISQLLNDHSLLLFRDQCLTPAQFARFSGAYGPLRVHDVAKYRAPDAPEVTILSNILDASGNQTGFVDVGHVWHTDASFLDKPHMYSFLHAIEIPHQDGRTLGSTWFVSSARAYDTLPETMQQRIAGLQAIHSFDNRYAKHKAATGREASRDSFKDRATLPHVSHPMVRRHPVTDRKSLYINELATVGIIGMPDGEAQALIAELCQHCTREDQIYRHQWRVGDVLIWDNCSSQHVAICDYQLPQRRKLYKATVQGTAPF